MAGSGGFGTVFVDHMTVVHWSDGGWDDPRLQPVGALQLHPGAHALHYGSSCFEGLKAHRQQSGEVRIFRLDRHVARLRGSADALCLPVPPPEMVERMITEVVRAGADDVPAPPGSLYLRPTLIGTEANVGAAAHPSAEATLFVLASPVGDYFAGGGAPLVVAIETDQPRTTPQFGAVKTGANYAMALKATREAQQRWGANQVLFAPGGIVQETGASNIVVIDDNAIITPARDRSFLEGVTRDSLLTLGADLGYRVEERELKVDELVALASHPASEVALSGTAAVLADVGALVHDGTRIPVGTGATGPHTTRLRQALTDIHAGRTPDRHGWLSPVG